MYYFLCLISYLRNHLNSHENQNFNISPDLSWPKRGLWIPVKKVRNPSYFGPLFSSLLEVEAEDFLSRVISHQKLLGSRRSFKGSCSWRQVVMEIHREIWNNDILRPELPLSLFNGNLCRVYTTSWVLKRELAAHSNQPELIQRGVS